MAENENEESQGTQNDTVDTGLQTRADELAAVSTQLEQEKTARAALEEAIEKKDSTIADLETKRGELEESSTKLAAELASVKEAKDQLAEALSVTKGKVLGMAKALNPTIPEGIIGGESIEEIDQSIEKGKAVVEAVKTAMESEAAAARVPAGAPTRGGISLEGMTPKEKIAYGIQQK